VVEARWEEAVVLDPTTVLAKNLTGTIVVVIVDAIVAIVARIAIVGVLGKRVVVDVGWEHVHDGEDVGRRDKIGLGGNRHGPNGEVLGALTGLGGSWFRSKPQGGKEGPVKGEGGLGHVVIIV
jgi:hypothetical protein